MDKSEIVECIRLLLVREVDYAARECRAGNMTGTLKELEDIREKLTNLQKRLSEE